MKLFILCTLLSMALGPTLGFYFQSNPMLPTYFRTTYNNQQQAKYYSDPWQDYYYYPKNYYYGRDYSYNQLNNGYYYNQYYAQQIQAQMPYYTSNQQQAYYWPSNFPAAAVGNGRPDLNEIEIADPKPSTTPLPAISRIIRQTTPALPEPIYSRTTPTPITTTTLWPIFSRTTPITTTTTWPISSRSIPSTWPTQTTTTTTTTPRTTTTESDYSLFETEHMIEVSSTTDEPDNSEDNRADDRDDDENDDDDEEYEDPDW